MGYLHSHEAGKRVRVEGVPAVKVLAPVRRTDSSTHTRTLLRLGMEESARFLTQHLHLSTITLEE